jgi:alkanesulfonate monooxygenase SsuD/methylene tetrahydromethanopterin reductase-like flavin-dependent oxidoreductase (luciferase family)/predicted kinase
VVLVGASGSGKSTWAEGRYRAPEVVSSDELRGIVGSGANDLDASSDAFRLLDLVVAARLGRRLTTVVDTLGFDPPRRLQWLGQARGAGLPAVVVLFQTALDVCRERNSQRDRPVPVRVLSAQVARARDVAAELPGEGWDRVVVVEQGRTAAASRARPSAAPPSPARPSPARPSPARPSPARPSTARPSSVRPSSVPRLHELGFVLHLSRFPWGQDPLAWLRSMAAAAAEAGFEGLSLMDHLIQIPQVGRAWDPIPEPWVTLGMLAGLETRLRFGTLVTPVTFRLPGVTAKAAATLSALTGGRAFVGVGAGWWAREHAAFGVGFPPAAERLDRLEAGIETMRALWAAGTKPYAGQRLSLPETTCYPRPVGELPVVVGGGGRRTLGIAARLGDACNLPSTEAGLAKIPLFRSLVEAAGRTPDDVAVTVLDLPVVGTDRDDVWRRLERLRGGVPAAAFAARHPAGTSAQHKARYRELVDRGVRTVFVAPPDLADADDVLALGPVVAAFA